MSPYFITIVLLILVVVQYIHSAWEKRLVSQEKAKLLTQIKDLSDKVYFTKTNDFLTYETLQTPPEPPKPENKEEAYVPLESVPYDEITAAFEAQNG